MTSGDVIAGRFEIGDLAGAGGMGRVYRARDRASGAIVAVKILAGGAEQHRERFVWEARLLEQLLHPSIVRHVAHGTTDDGALFLAMEWLDGEDLAARLRRGPLSVAESLLLTGRVADALRAIHAEGIVHRDLKPANLFLRHGDIAQVTLLDFGVAHLGGAAALTRTGEMIGTVAYMAPEQARGERAISPATDLFALGCVLHEALAGQPLFSGGQIQSVLARILYEEVRDVRLARPEVPASFAALLLRLLTKEPAARLRDGAALCAALDALPTLGAPDTASAAASVRPAGLRGTTELLTVLVTRWGDTVAAGSRDVLDDLRAVGGEADLLLDGSLVAVFRGGPGAPSAVDQAVQAAQAALLLRERWPAAPLGVATGRGRDTGRGLVGEAVDRACRLLAEAPTGEPLLDELTTGLLADRFELAPVGGGAHALRGARGAADGSRLLLGRPTPCVGRESELVQLQHLVDTTVDESAASAVLVLGPPGSGKSRLRHELLRRVADRGRGELVLAARGAPLSVGVPFSLVGEALRGLTAAAELVGELARLGAGAVEPARVLGADPAVVSDGLVRAVIELLHAECAARPVLLVLDDLQWADGASLRLLDAVLRELSEEPLLVLALARPELRERFPDLWRHRRRFELSLRGLPRNACERLIREVLGERLPADVEERMIVRSAGNALFLEELIRAAAEGRTEGVPETVLAMLQARLSRLQPDARAVLCAASVFGTTFPRGGVAALLSRGDEEELAHLYPRLLDQELIERAGGIGGPAVEHRFRHDLVREAAYGLLAAEDLALGHELAARHLIAAPERDTFAIAEHLRRGGASVEAAAWYGRAARQALAANDLEGAHERAQRALDGGAADPERGSLLGLQADAAIWLGRDGEARRCAEAALASMPAGTPEWYLASGHLMVTAGRQRAWDAVERGLQAVLSSQPADDARAPLASCLARVGYMNMMQGRPDEMERIALALAARVTELPDTEPVAQAQVNHFRFAHALWHGDVVGGLRHLSQTIADFARAGDHRNACLERGTVAILLIENGRHEEAARQCRDNLVECERLRAPAARNLAELMLGFALTFSPERWSEAAAHLDAAIERSAASGHRRYEVWARATRARLRYHEGRAAEAEREARGALELCGETPTLRTWPLGWLARTLVAHGRAEEGLRHAEDALASLKQVGIFTMDVAVPRLGQIEALEALGRNEEARAAAQAARRRLLRRAERLTEPGWRESLLAHPEHARLLALGT